MQKITWFNNITANQSINYLFVIYAFMLPVSRTGISVFTALLFIVWFFTDDFKNRIKFLKSNKTIIYLLLFMGFSFLSLLWSDNISSGIYYIRKYWYYVAIFVIATTVTKKYIEHAISAFLIAMLISEVLSYGIFFELWTFKNSSPDFPTPFMNHIQYSVFLAFTALLLLNRLFYVHEIKYKLFYFLYFLTVTANLFLNAGRTGQVAFIASIFILAFLNIKNKFLALFGTLLLVSLIFFISYQVSPNFKERVNAGISDIQKITQQNSYCNSWGLRLGAWINAKEIFMNNPLLGTGVTNEMSILKENIVNNHPDMLCVKDITSYHNYFVQTSVRLGVVGLFLYLMIYYSLFRLGIKDKQYYTLMVIFITVYSISSLVENLFHEQFTQALLALFIGIFIAQNRLENQKD